MPNIIFHHLPKTAGRGLRSWLDRQLGPDKVYWPLDSQTYQGWFKQLMGGQTIKPRDNKLLLVGGHDTFIGMDRFLGWNAPLHITVLRHPAERLYSHYCHYKRGGKASESIPFEAWASGCDHTWKICSCMWCRTGTTTHTNNPIAWFYASKVGPAEGARQFLSSCLVYRMTEIPLLVDNLSNWLEIDRSDYKPMDITGNGSKITQEQRGLVAINHPIDMELWEEFGR